MLPNKGDSLTTSVKVVFRFRGCNTSSLGTLPAQACARQSAGAGGRIQSGEVSSIVRNQKSKKTAMICRWQRAHVGSRGRTFLSDFFPVPPVSRGRPDNAYLKMAEINPGKRCILARLGDALRHVLPYCQKKWLLKLDRALTNHHDRKTFWMPILRGLDITKDCDLALEGKRMGGGGSQRRWLAQLTWLIRRGVRLPTATAFLVPYEVTASKFVGAIEKAFDNDPEPPGLSIDKICFAAGYSKSVCRLRSSSSSRSDAPIFHALISETCTSRRAKTSRMRASGSRAERVKETRTRCGSSSRACRGRDSAP